MQWGSLSLAQVWGGIRLFKSLFLLQLLDATERIMKCIWASGLDHLQNLVLACCPAALWRRRPRLGPGQGPERDPQSRGESVEFCQRLDNVAPAAHPKPMQTKHAPRSFQSRVCSNDIWGLSGPRPGEPSLRIKWPWPLGRRMSTWAWAWAGPGRPGPAWADPGPGTTCTATWKGWLGTWGSPGRTGAIQEDWTSSTTPAWPKWASRGNPGRPGDLGRRETIWNDLWRPRWTWEDL